MRRGDLLPENVQAIAHRLDVSEKDVIAMNRRMAAPDSSLNAPLKQDGEGEWQDWLVDEAPDQETAYGDRQELEQRRAFLLEALETLNERERHILERRRLGEEPTTLEDLSKVYGHQPRAGAARSRSPPSRSSRRRRPAPGGRRALRHANLNFR